MRVKFSTDRLDAGGRLGNGQAEKGPGGPLNPGQGAKNGGYGARRKTEGGLMRWVRSPIWPEHPGEHPQSPAREAVKCAGSPDNSGGAGCRRAQAQRVAPGFSRKIECRDVTPDGGRFRRRTGCRRAQAQRVAPGFSRKIECRDVTPNGGRFRRRRRPCRRRCIPGCDPQTHCPREQRPARTWRR
jgi:hypothetical protein